MKKKFLLFQSLHKEDSRPSARLVMRRARGFNPFIRKIRDYHDPHGEVCCFCGFNPFIRKIRDTLNYAQKAGKSRFNPFIRKIRDRRGTVRNCVVKIIPQPPNLASLVRKIHKP